MLGGQGGTEVSVAAPDFPQHPLFRCGGDPAIRRPAPQPMNDTAIPFGRDAPLQPPHLPGAQPQTPCRFYLREMPLLDFVHNLQPISFPCAQCHPLLSHWSPRTLEKRTFLLCTNRTFSLCSDSWMVIVVI